AARCTAVVTQERTSDFEFSVYEIVLMGRNPHKGLVDRYTAADAGIVEDALRQVNMLAFAACSFHALSGGEKQRVLVARALAQQARFLILDEPTNHLDIRYQLEILTLLKRLGTTTLAALHDLNLAAWFCDRLFLLKDGRVVVSGSPEDVLQPAHIRAVYGVDAHVERHRITGQLQITFFPLANPLLTHSQLEKDN
ncbi:MAG: ABC transporter ATP-binding protein, partial [Caldilineaceae bacterium]|nr:ABC transporter ATP-binding protein [Caldilineaceae bacterium]